MFRIIAALALACVLSACQISTSPEGWRQIAIGVGAVIGETKIDPQIEKVSKRLAEYCVTVQTAAVAVDVLAPPKVQSAARDAGIVVATFCASPPKNIAQALIALADANAALQAAKREA